MNDVRNKYVSPSISEVAFNCPHCGALAKQFWYRCYVDRMDSDRTPMLIPKGTEAPDFADIEDEAKRQKFIDWFEKMTEGRPFCSSGDEKYRLDYVAYNVSVSRCFNCEDISIWTYDQLVWPATGEAPLSNPDLPDEIRDDYNEASSILDKSPRGAAALLRLAIQKLCVYLKRPGENLNDDIAALVKEGLDARVQQALDVLRVIGNEAVHPGQIDLNDDRAIAEELFGLVNLIADIMISQPKHIEAIYEKLPQSKKDAIAKRDEGA